MQSTAMAPPTSSNEVIMPTLMVKNLFRNRGDMAFPLSQHVIGLVSENRFVRFTEQCWRFSLSTLRAICCCQCTTPNLAGSCSDPRCLRLARSTAESHDAACTMHDAAANDVAQAPGIIRLSISGSRIWSRNRHNEFTSKRYQIPGSAKMKRGVLYFRRFDAEPESPTTRFIAVSQGDHPTLEQNKSNSEQRD